MLTAGAVLMAEAVQPNAISPNQPPEGRKVPKSNIGQGEQNKAKLRINLTSIWQKGNRFVELQAMTIIDQFRFFKMKSHLMGLVKDGLPTYFVFDGFRIGNSFSLSFFKILEFYLPMPILPLLICDKISLHKSAVVAITIDSLKEI